MFNNNIYNLFKILEKTILSFLIIIMFSYFYIFSLNFNFLRYLVITYILFLFLFLLYITFVFFLKRYKYSKFTSQIQRFWKRAFMSFWIIEMILFLVFFYLLLTASSEPPFFQDMYHYLKTYNVSWRNFLKNSFLIIMLLLLFYYLNFYNNIFSYSNNLYILIPCIFIFIYILFKELYQLFFVVQVYYNFIWVYDSNNYFWKLNYDTIKMKPVLHFLNLCLILKFWHFIFIFLSFIFFISKILEKKKISYSLLAFQQQNFIFLYLMNFICMYTWVKIHIKLYMTKLYFWFYTNNKSAIFNSFFKNFFLYFKKLLKFSLNNNKYFNFDFFYFHIFKVNFFYNFFF